MIRLITLFALLILTATSCVAMQINVSEYEVKAAFLYNFAKFVTWPIGTFPYESGVFVIGVLGDELFSEHLTHVIGGKRIGDHTIETRLCHDADEIDGCHIIFITASFAGPVEPLLDKLKGRPLLIVGDRERFAHMGGMVNLERDGDRMVIEICMSALKSAGMEVSSRLLGLAKLVPCPERETGK